MIARTVVKRSFSRAPALCLAALFALALCGSASRSSFASGTDAQDATEAVHAAPLSVTEEDPHMAGTHIEPPLNEYEDAIEGFEKADTVHHHPKACTLFLGSSTFAMWGPVVETKFKRFDAINRAFGGSTIKEITHYVDEIVFPYEPCRIVFYAGTNDIFDNHTPYEVYRDFLAFEKAVRAKLPQVEIFFISMSTPPSRMHWQKQYDRANRLVFRHMVRAPHDHWIEVRDVMRDKNGRLRTEWFRKDKTHMLDVGYQHWEPRIWKALLSDERRHPCHLKPTQ
jgi:lysophospholipase L1-like esterase